MEQPQLNKLRDQVSTLDSQLLKLLAQRMDLCAHIGNIKKLKGLEVEQPEQAQKKLDDLLREGKELGLSETFIRQYWAAIHTESCNRQKK